MRRSLVCLALVAGVAGSLALAGIATAAFPGTPGRIVFVSSRDGNQEIYDANPDGSNPRRLTNDPAIDSEPALSPDGTKIAFVRSGDIWVMNSDGGAPAPITGTEGAGDNQPAWSPDGSKIVYVSNHGTPSGGTTGFELWVKDALPNAPFTQLTDTPNNASSRSPSWSPVGNQIAYESNADGGFEIYTIDAGATASFGTRRSANEVGQNYMNPSWSPDATRIAFERGIGTNVRDNTKEIWTMRADGTDLVRLTNNSVYDAKPAYSPDCIRIAYETDETSDLEVFTRPAVAGGASANVSNLAGVDDQQPDWGVGFPPPVPVACASSPAGGGPGGGGGPTGPLTLADLDNPTLGVDVNVQAVSGTVLIGVRNAAAGAARAGRASQKGITFVPLTEARQVPVGSFLDTRRGTVRLESAANAAGRRQRGNFLRGVFQVLQSKKRSARGLTNLVLKGSSFKACRAGRTTGASAALSRRRIRQLRANARGRFRTSGRYSSATVRGTAWTVQDRCDGTLTTVQRGRVVVRDFRRKRNISVSAGKRYLAKAPG